MEKAIYANNAFTARTCYYVNTDLCNIMKDSSIILSFHSNLLFKFCFPSYTLILVCHLHPIPPCFHWLLTTFPVRVAYE
jgi:hypothetical protein